MKRTLLFLSLCLPAFAFTQSWSDQNSGITNDLNDISFVDDNNGWAVGRQGKIIHTTNGGVTWTQQNSGTTNDLNKISMVSGSAGFAVGDGGTVVKYNGTSWSAVGIGYSQDMYGVHFLDASTGWISGDYGRIMKTTNGGSNWSTQMDNTTYSNTFYDLCMISATEGWAVGSSGKTLKYNGTNWSSVSNPASGNLLDQYAASFVSSGDGFMTGASSSVYHWDGSSWNTQNTALSSNSYHVYDVRMISSTLAYAVTTPGFGGGGVILKYDGSTWSNDYEYTGMNSELFSGITSTPNGNLYAVGATGMIKMKASGGSGTTGIAVNKSNTPGVRTYPSPFTSAFTISLPATETGPVSITLKDLSGRTVKTLVSERGHEISVDGSDLPAGMYLYTATTASLVANGSVIKN